MGRAEAFALQNGPKESILDGLGNGIGYGWILITVAVRELLVLVNYLVLKFLIMSG